ncbi:hypothetical protein BGX27_009819 [Mortierella sp. AM989]|nr:hypothetical protein BGX27_009819 [Mortierella sp. AM989]
MYDPISPFDIPHIADLIGQRLSKKDAISCALVNKSFYAQFERWWLRSIRVWLYKDLLQYYPIPIPLGLELQEKFLKNRRYIRELDLLEPQKGELIEFIANKLSPCQLVSLRYSGIENDLPPKPILLLMDLIERNPALQTLDLRFFEGADLACIRIRLISTISVSPYLTTLRLWENMNIHYKDYLALLKRLPMTLQTFEIDWCIEEDVEVNEVVHFPDVDWPKVYPNLQNLSMDLNLYELEDILLFPFLRRCPSLEKLRITLCEGEIHDKFYPLIADVRVFPRLTNIDIQIENQSSSSRTPLVSGMEGRIKTFAMNGPVFQSPYNMCRRWGTTLEVIRIGWSSTIDGGDIELILTNCSKLKTFTVSTDINDHNEDQIRGQTGFWALTRGTYLEANKWVCMDLEHLEMTFMDVRAADPTILNRSFNQSMLEIQTVTGIHSIYYQIGRLTKLQHLRLRWSTVKKFQNRANLDMSIGSGLMHMEKLKELEILDVTCIQQVNIEQEEVEWMEENWPKLQRIKGLFAKNSRRHCRLSDQEHLCDEDADRVNRDESNDPMPIQWFRSQRSRLVIT